MFRPPGEVDKLVIFSGFFSHKDKTERNTL